MKVLFSFVGHRDPIPGLRDGKGEGEGAIVTAARASGAQAALLWFLAGRGDQPDSTTEPNAELTREYLQMQVRPGMEVALGRLPVADPRDYEALLVHTRQSLLEYLARKEVVESVVSLSSGTPQQQACLLLLLAGGLFPNPTVLQVAEPRFAAGGERVQIVRLTFLEEERLLARAPEHARQGLFRALAEDLERLQAVTLHPDRRRKALAWQTVARAAECWDRFDYPQAYRLLAAMPADSLRDLGGWESAARRARRLLAGLVRACQRGRDRPLRSLPTVDFLVDLYWNVARCLRQGRTVDALVRAWRLIEGVGLVRLASHRIDPFDLEASPPERAEPLRRYARFEGRLFTLLHQAEVYRALEEGLRDEAVRHLLDSPADRATVREALEWLRSARNHTPAAHGMCPVEEDLARSAHQLAGRVLAALTGALLSDHPLARLEALAEAMRESLR